MRLVILGAGGYGRTVADVAAQTGRYAEICFLDDHGDAPDVIGACCNFSQMIDDETIFYLAFGNNDGPNGLAAPTDGSRLQCPGDHPSRLRMSARRHG